MIYTEDHFMAVVHYPDGWKVINSHPGDPGYRIDATYKSLPKRMMAFMWCLYEKTDK